MPLSPPDQRLLEQLRRGLRAPDLPGLPAQLKMAPPLRGKYSGPPDDARRASVMALLYPIDGILHILYIQRTSPANDRHAGQISFPGGSVDPGDIDAVDTALRELEEEVGIGRTGIEVLGPLTQLYIPVSNFLVDPFVGYLTSRPELTLQETEVARTLELPLADFLAPDALQIGPRKLANGMTLTEVPYWSVAGEEIWGATSMMTAELVAVLERGTFDRPVRQAQGPLSGTAAAGAKEGDQ
ncbi:MAG: NUDIX domain-containing protein [Bacteroidota bacterium]